MYMYDDRIGFAYCYHYIEIIFILLITFISGRYRQSTAAVTPAEYGKGKGA